MHVRFTGHDNKARMRSVSQGRISIAGTTTVSHNDLALESRDLRSVGKTRIIL